MADLADFVTRGFEARDLEYKESQPWDTLRWKIAKTAMALTNLRDGGAIVVGVSQRGGRFEPVGMDPEHLATYAADEVRAFINSFADPFVEARMHIARVDEGQFVVVVVDEFDDVPCLSRKGGDGIQVGRMYVRSRRIIETTELQSHHDLREVIDMATEKALRRLLSSLGRAGVSTVRLASAAAEARFAQELEGI